MEGETEKYWLLLGKEREGNAFPITINPGAENRPYKCVYRKWAAVVCGQRVVFFHFLFQGCNLSLLSQHALVMSSIKRECGKWGVILMAWHRSKACDNACLINCALICGIAMWPGVCCEMWTAVCFLIWRSIIMHVVRGQTYSAVRFVLFKWMLLFAKYATVQV